MLWLFLFSLSFFFFFPDYAHAIRCAALTVHISPPFPLQELGTTIQPIPKVIDKALYVDMSGDGEGEAAAASGN